MAEQLLTGLPASPGEAFGYAHMLAVVVDPASATPILEAERPAVLAAARAALAAAGAELDALAARLRAEGRGSEAEIVETGVLMAADPALDAALESAVVRDGRPAAAALVEACGVHADAIAALPDPVLAARADDVRSLGRRAARGVGEAGDRVAGVGDRPPGAAAGESLILVADDLGPADVAELDPRVAGIALVAGGPSAHAAVVARGLGVPMTVGLGAALLAVADGEPLALDGAAGTVAVRPVAGRAGSARRAQAARERERAETEAAAALPAVTADGRAVRVLVNAATAAEVQAGLRAGAEGVGLLRTELAFLHAAEWPDETAHRRALAPVLDPLAGRTATVRVLDFGADKTPPFLAGIATRGLALVLEHREALAAQLRAIAGAGKRTQLRVLLPLVEAAEQVETVRALLPRGARVGAMIETRAAVAAVDEIAAAADFLSIGTNDLTADVLGADRFTPEGAVAHDPRVLAAVAATTAAAHHAGQIVEVCGEAASEPLMVPLLVGLSVDELSVGAARVGATRAAIRALDAGAATRLAAAALRAADAAAVAELLRQAGDAAGESGHSGRPVVTLGQQA
jgi:phosphoenolpyruvate-protein kinase (PTS system EI component)